MLSINLKEENLIIRIMGPGFNKNTKQLRKLGAEFNKQDKVWILNRHKIDKLLEEVGHKNVAYNVPLQTIRGEKIEKPDPLEDIEIDNVGLEDIELNIPEFQMQGINFLEKKKRTILGDDMGCGKTIQAGLALRKLIYKGDIINTLVVSPSSVKLQWEDELREKCKLPSTIAINGTPKQRKKQWQEAYDHNIVIVNYEMFLNESDLKYINDIEFDAIILDEAHYIKNPGAKRTKQILKYKPEYVFHLTGTPMMNRADEIHTLMKHINPDVLGKKTDFSKKYIVEVFNPALQRKQLLGYRNLHEIHQKISPYMLRREKSDVVDQLPERVTQDRRILLTSAQDKIIASLAQEIETIKKDTELNEDEVFRKIMGIRNLMSGVTNTPEKFYKSKNKRLSLNDKKSPKMDAIKEILSDYELPTVIFTRLISTQMAIMRNLDKECTYINGTVTNTKREEAKKKFQNGEVDIIVCTDAAKEGLNLTRGEIFVNYDLPWNDTSYEQRIGRIERMGNKSDSIIVINLLGYCLNTQSIDMKMLETIKSKKEDFDIVIKGNY